MEADRFDRFSGQPARTTSRPWSGHPGRATARRATPATGPITGANLRLDGDQTYVANDVVVHSK